MTLRDILPSFAEQREGRAKRQQQDNKNGPRNHAQAAVITFWHITNKRDTPIYVNDFSV